MYRYTALYIYGYNTIALAGNEQYALETIFSTETRKSETRIAMEIMKRDGIDHLHIIILDFEFQQ